MLALPLRNKELHTPNKDQQTTMCTSVKNRITKQVYMQYIIRNEGTKCT